MANVPDLRRLQRDGVTQMLRDATLPTSQTDSNPWKILVFDNAGRDIIAPILKVKELRDLGVTLHLSLHSNRQPVPGVPVVYFCEPTLENIERIGSDCTSELYSCVYVNFLAQVERSRLEHFAELLSPLPSIHHVHVFDRTLWFIGLQRNLFTLLSRNSFADLHSRTTTDAEMEGMIESTVTGLSHLFISTQCLPIIACSRSGPSQMVAERASSVLHDLLKEQVLPPTPSAQRPVLLVVDRSEDMASVIHQPFSYHGLLTDNLDFRLNKVDIASDTGSKSFELDPDTDTFWIDNAGQDFGMVSEQVESALSSYKKEYSALTAASGVSSTEANNADTVTQLLSQAPKLAERKRHVDTHTTVAYAVLNAIKRRKLDSFHGVGQGLLHGEEFDKKHFVELLESEAEQDDKDRLFLLAYLCCQGEEDRVFVESHLSTVLGKRESLPGLNFLRNLRSWEVKSENGATEGSGWKIAANFTQGFSKAFGGGSTTKLALTQKIDSLWREVRGRPMELSLFDPRTKESLPAAPIKAPWYVVFVIGGCTTSEYEDLSRWSDEVGAPVIYGGSEMLTGKKFLEQISDLGLQC